MVFPEPGQWGAIQALIRDQADAILPEDLVVDLLTRLMEVLILENNCLVLRSPIVICGDTHGQLSDLIFLFEQTATFTSDQTNFVFLGDYVDRGLHSLHTFLYLACMKLKFPERYFLLRGNHESRAVSQTYGLMTELVAAYGSTALWHFVQAAFDLLPLAALIDGEVFCVHGGISPSLPLVEKISLLNRCQEPPNQGPLTDLLWSDPDETEEWIVNRRGAGYVFGSVQTHIFCHLNRVRFIARAHQMMLPGFAKTHFDAPEEEETYRCLTVFSAPGYGKAKNKGAILAFKCDGKEEREIIQFGKAKNQFRRPQKWNNLAQLPQYELEL